MGGVVVGEKRIIKSNFGWGEGVDGWRGEGVQSQISNIEFLPTH